MANNVIVVMSAEGDYYTSGDDISTTTSISDLTSNGALTYNWYYRSDEPGSKRVYLGAENEGKEGFIAKPVSEFKNCASSDVYDASKNYYVHQAEPAPGGYVVAMDVDAASFNADPTKYYERYTGVSIVGEVGNRVTGSYFVEAINRPAVRPNSAFSAEFILERPTQPEITKGTNFSSVVTLDENSNMANLDYVVSTGDDTSTIITTEYYRQAASESSFSKYTNNNGSLVKDTGYYYLVATGVKNLDTTTSASVSNLESIDLGECVKVVALPSQPILIAEQQNSEENGIYEVPVNDTITVAFDQSFNPNDAFVSDEIRYVWRMLAKDVDDEDNDGNTEEYIEYAMGPSLQFTADMPAVPVYCEVTNVLNGRSSDAVLTRKYIINN
jgi:hypothetical protein